MGYIAADASRPHLVHWTFVGELSVDIYRAILDHAEEHARTQELTKHAFVMDSSRGVPPSAAERKVMAESRRRTAKYAEEYTLCMAVVNTSRVLQAMTAAAQWAVPKRVQKIPLRVFGTLPQAMTWSRAQMAEKGYDMDLVTQAPVLDKNFFVYGDREAFLRESRDRIAGTGA